MNKKLFITFIIFLLVIFTLGCSSTSSSENKPFNTSIFDNTQSAISDLSTAASDSTFVNLYYYEETFANSHGGFPFINKYIDMYKYFSLKAVFDSVDSKWKAIIVDPFNLSMNITLYGEMVNGYYWIHREGASPDQGLFYYPNNDSLTINIIKSNPTDTNPSFRAELYKQGDYYYGFILYDLNMSMGFLIKFKFENTDPCTNFVFKFGTYEANAIAISKDNYNYIINDIPSAITNISSYNFIRNRSVSASDWYSSEDTKVLLYALGNYDGSTFTYQNLMAGN